MSDTTDSPACCGVDFCGRCEQFPTRVAIDVAGHEVTYQQLANRAKCLAATLEAAPVPGAVPLTAVFAYRSDAYTAVLGALMAGNGARNAAQRKAAGIHAPSRYFSSRPVPAKCERQI